MELWLEVDGQRVEEIENFRIDEPPKVQVWGPVWPHLRQSAPGTCTFTIAGAPPQEGLWINVVDDEGTPLHELRLLHVATKMGLGSATSTVKAQLL